MIKSPPREHAVSWLLIELASEREEEVATKKGEMEILKYEGFSLFSLSPFVSFLSAGRVLVPGAVPCLIFDVGHFAAV